MWYQAINECIKAKNQKSFVTKAFVKKDSLFDCFVNEKEGSDTVVFP